MNDWLSARHLLAIRLDNSGDIVMLGPALRAVKETSPHVHLTLLASPAGAQAAPLLPWVDEVIAWRTTWQDVGQHLPFDPAYELKLVNLLANQRIDGALIFTSCHPCYLFECPIGLACLDIPPEEIIETIEDLLGTSESARAQGQASGMGGSQ